MNAPTAKQLEVLAAIKGHIAVNGYAPSLREIAAAVGIVSTNGVREHLVALEKKGLIRRSPTKSRAIVVCEPVGPS